ncbi:hypothetical protein [Calycomorphotria hydatis]|uniref:Uncharacterized protein n=1 Tax=Calycomorphotria hydatis TaxID=2528027 RepID=A0A517TEK3_9PLAN|nr:hypothetical protein [Calycomorphotria hydatis]QDT66799.1 hypothetical protein V22_40700 [Calycomorphotria hydatis]
MKTRTSFTMLALAAMALGSISCSDSVNNVDLHGQTTNTTSHDHHDGHEHDEHAHPDEGPHHGDLIELGNEEFHAEIIHDDDAGTVTIYVLNSVATEQVPIDATEITINAKHDGKPEQFTLAASPDANDPQGKSSRFVSNDEELMHHLDEEGAVPRLVVTINGKSYRGTITHDHDHKGHDH